MVTELNATVDGQYFYYRTVLVSACSHLYWLGSSFCFQHCHCCRPAEFAEFLVYQIMFSEEEEPDEEVDIEKLNEEVRERGQLLDALSDPRMMSLFVLFDRDGDSTVSFKGTKCFDVCRCHGNVARLLSSPSNTRRQRSK